MVVVPWAIVSSVCLYFAWMYQIGDYRKPVDFLLSTQFVYTLSITPSQLLGLLWYHLRGFIARAFRVFCYAEVSTPCFWPGPRWVAVQDRLGCYSCFRFYHSVGSREVLYTWAHNSAHVSTFQYFYFLSLTCFATSLSTLYRISLRYALYNTYCLHEILALCREGQRPIPGREMIVF